MRPETMRIVDDLRDQNILNLEHAKRDNQKIVGMYCAYSPKELVLAAGALPVSLCGTKQEPIAAAEKILPRNICPLIKSSFGFAITDTCPYFRMSDYVIAETTCDGKKKMFEMLKDYKPMHVLHLPQGTNRPGALKWWTDELYLLKSQLEENLGVEISRESLRKAIKLVNKERLAMRKLHELNKVDPAPLSGLDMLTTLWMKGFNVDVEEGIELINQLAEEVEEIVRLGASPFAAGTPRILLTGCPVGLGSEKVLRLLEECGGSVVGLENCSGFKTVDTLVDEDEARDPMEAIAEKYLQIPCSCMSHNEGRFDLIDRMIEEYKVDGVVDLTWQACHTYNVEGELLSRRVKEKYDLPYLHLETDYSTSDLQQLQTRIGAFIELLNRRKA
ncbi:R-phenyllactate dehydratase beta subunit [Sporotomaculum syntrophicum]|uniref:R-phenyllactate dehydratase beta subunit n=1 Tax=Sporotomaculum syntrophicum TaxID=182264 RepID=A0A9D2WMZ4_9FIRM|nr:double-cubane-cluster-containing anaerobic reductase [Sporotomaculum syntrophicum]KAF1084169.1 R-phenyllactate dehydratase beta subunit [Sporotomaculum syntrophicum]